MKLRSSSKTAASGESKETTRNQISNNLSSSTSSKRKRHRMEETKQESKDVKQSSLRVTEVFKSESRDGGGNEIVKNIEEEFGGSEKVEREEEVVEGPLDGAKNSNGEKRNKKSTASRSNDQSSSTSKPTKKRSKANLVATSSSSKPLQHGAKRSSARIAEQNKTGTDSASASASDKAAVAMDVDSSPGREEEEDKERHVDSDEDDDNDDDDDDEPNHLAATASSAPPPSRNSLLMNALQSSNSHEKLIALQDLSEILVVATEEDFMRSSNPLNASALVKVLISILSSTPDPFSSELNLGAELMILACRCLYNLISAIPSSLSIIAHGKGVEALVDKLMEIEYIDLAEMALKVLEEISVEYPSYVLRANGLFACLQFLDFFGIHIQRTAVSIVANTCRALPPLPSSTTTNTNNTNSGLEAHAKISMVMDTIVRLVGYSDAKIVENAAKSISRITDWCSRCPSPSIASDRLQELFPTHHLLSLVEYITMYADPRLQQSSSSAGTVFLLIVNSVAKIAKCCPQQEVRGVLIGDLKVLAVIRGIVGASGNEQDMISFAISRPAEQVLAVLDLLNDLMPPLQATGVWKVLHHHQDPVSGNSVSDPNSAPVVINEVPDSVIQQYLDQILPVLFDVFMTSSSQSVRKRIVICVAKIISYGKAELVSAQLKLSKRFGKFVFELVHYHKSCIKPPPSTAEDAAASSSTTTANPTASTAPSAASLREEQLLVFAGVCIALEVSEKFGSDFVFWFSREGVLSELGSLSEKCPADAKALQIASTGAPADNNNTSAEIAANFPAATGMAITEGLTATATPSDLPLRPPENGAELVEMLQEFLQNPSMSVAGAGTSPALAGLATAGDFSENERAAIAARLNHIRRIFNPGPSSSNQGVFYGFTSEKLNPPALIARIHDLADRMITLSSKNATPTSSSEISDLLMDLVEAGSGGDVEKTGLVMKVIANRITETGNDFSSKVTHYELFSGNLVHVLNSFLSNPAVNEASGHLELYKVESLVIEWKVGLHERIMLFMDAFFDVSKGDSAFNSLIFHLQEYISRLDLLPIMSASNSESFFPGRDFSKQLKLQLSPLDSSSTNFPQQHMNVYVPAVASFKVLEHYIKTRLQSAPSGGGGPSGSAAVITDQDQGESDVEEDEIDISASPYSSSATEMAIALEKSASQASSASHRSSTSSKIPKPATATAGSTKNKQFISFFIDGKEVSSDSTLFGAFYHHSSPSSANSISDSNNIIFNIWKTSHTLQFKFSSKRSTPLATSSKKQSSPCICTICNQFLSNFGFEQTDDGFGSNNKELASALFLIGLLNQINGKFSLNRVIKTETPVFISPLQFVNNKLTTKVARQISEPLMSVSGIYPAWHWSLVYNYSFLLPFDLRLKFLKVTAMGYARNMTHWLEYHKSSQQSNRSGGGGGPRLENSVRPERLKVRINREAVFESLVKVLGIDGHHKTMLEVEFFHEVGSGLGPTLEFFTLVCKCIRMRKGTRRSPLEKRILIWRDDEVVATETEYLNPKMGLYPRPQSGESASLGSFVAKSFLDSRQLDLQFNPLFIKQVFSSEPSSFVPVSKSGDHFEDSLLKIKAISPQLYSSLTALKRETDAAAIDAMVLDFTLPGFPDHELLPSGANISVTSQNLMKYCSLVVDATVGSGVTEQIDSFRQGFDRIIPIHYFGCFTHEEIMNIIGGDGNSNWALQDLMDSIKVDHGYNVGSRLIQQLIEMLCQFSEEERRLFLSFCTGSPRLPIGGFASLNPPLTIVRKSVGKQESADEFLPSVMTCAHYLKVPEYTTADVMRQRFLFAMKEGQNSFHLS